MDLPPCTDTISEYYGVPRIIIEAIAEQEGGAPGVVAHNNNGTTDVGVMQINSAWFEPNNPVDLPARGITLERVRDNACLNIAIGTWIFEQYYHQMDGDLGRALAAYNAGPGNWQAGVDYARSVSVKLWKRLN